MLIHRVSSSQLFIGHLDQRLLSSKNSNTAMSRHPFCHFALAVKIGKKVEKYMEKKCFPAGYSKAANWYQVTRWRVKDRMTRQKIPSSHPKYRFSKGEVLLCPHCWEEAFTTDLFHAKGWKFWFTRNSIDYAMYFGEEQYNIQEMISKLCSHHSELQLPKGYFCYLYWWSLGIQMWH